MGRQVFRATLVQAKTEQGSFEQILPLPKEPLSLAVKIGITYEADLRRGSADNAFTIRASGNFALVGKEHDEEYVKMSCRVFGTFELEEGGKAELDDKNDLISEFGVDLFPLIRNVWTSAATSLGIHGLTIPFTTGSRTVCDKSGGARKAKIEAKAVEGSSQRRKRSGK